MTTTDTQRGADGGEGRVEEAVARLRDRHLRTSDAVEVSCCAWDDADWPCDTAIVLDALESAITRAASAETQRDFYRAMWARRGDVVTGLTARLEAAERVVADLAEDIERRLVMGVGTISSQHVLRRLGRPWTFEEVSRTLLHDAARTREDQP